MYVMLASTFTQKIVNIYIFLAIYIIVRSFVKLLFSDGYRLKSSKQTGKLSLLIFSPIVSIDSEKKGTDKNDGWDFLLFSAGLFLIFPNA